MRIWVLLALSVLCIACSPFIGLTNWSDISPFIIWKLRVPRLLNGVIVGATLSLSGCAFQSLFSNSLATPSTTGTTAGASLGALIVIILFPTELSQNHSILAFSAFSGALLISLPLAWMATRQHVRVEDVLLAGIGCTLAMGALTTGLQFTADMSETYRAVQWSLGTLSHIGYNASIGLVIPCTISLLGLLSQRKALSSLISGEEMAWNQGVNLKRVRSLTLLFAAIGVGSTVAWCGPIAFVGLLVPHMIRLVLGRSGTIVFYLSPLVGGAFLVMCDTIGRSIISGIELPVGVITAGIGAPLLIALIFSQRQQR